MLVCQRRVLAEVAATALLLDSYPFVFEKELMAGVVKAVMVGGSGAAERSWLRRVACVTRNLETAGEGGRNAAAGERQPKERLTRLL